MDQKINEIEINGVKYVPKNSACSQPVNVDGLKAVIIRSYAAGVHFGFLKERKAELNGVNVTLVNTRRVWYWDGAASLSQMALEGVKKPENCKFSVEIPENEIENCVEIIALSDKAYENLKEVPVWKNE